jgi:hypothetical protein
MAHTHLEVVRKAHITFDDCSLFFFFSKTGFLCVALAVLELTL